MLANFAVVVPTRQTALYTRWQHICPVPDLHKHHPNLNLELLFSHLLCWAREKKSFRLHEKSFFFLLGCGKSDFQHCTTLTMERKRRRRKKMYMKNCGNGNHLQAASLNLQNSCFFAQQIFAQPTLHVSPPSFATPLVHRTSPAIALLCDFNVAVFFSLLIDVLLLRHLWRGARREKTHEKVPPSFAMMLFSDEAEIVF